MTQPIPSLLVAMLVTGTASVGAAAVIVVPATSNILGAGHGAPPGDGTLPPSVHFVFAPGSVIAIQSAAGAVSCGSICRAGNYADGGSYAPFNVANGTNILPSNNGLSGVQFAGRQMFLTGVFLNSSLGEPSGAGPATLSYTDSSANGASFSPLLGQMFFIGDGQRPAGQQAFLVPTNANRLYLGFAEGTNFVGTPGGYLDNTGTITVDVRVTGGVVAEQCDNCVDDDGDDRVDREDPDCLTPANGGNQGIGDATRGKVLTGCEKAIQRAGQSFVLAKVKRMQKCLDIASTCVQLKPDDGACRAKAIVGCGKGLAGIGADALKLEAAILKACDADGQGLPDLLDLKGIGFAAEQASCAAEGTASLGTVASVAGCIRAQHSCRAEHLVAIAAPRAGELLAFAGRQPGAEFPCLGDVAGAISGNSGVTPAPKAKALFKCGKTIEKVAVDLTKARAKSAQSCILAGMTCLQVKSDDLLCLPKASIKCGKLLDKLNDPANGTLAKLGEKLVNVCSDPELSPVDIGDPTGLGFYEQMLRCGELGFGSPGVDGLVECLNAQLLCNAGRIAEREVPRVRELATLLGVEIPGI